MTGLTVRRSRAVSCGSLGTMARSSSSMSDATVAASSGTRPNSSCSKSPRPITRSSRNSIDRCPSSTVDDVTTCRSARVARASLRRPRPMERGSRSTSTMTMRSTWSVSPRTFAVGSRRSPNVFDGLPELLWSDSEDQIVRHSAPHLTLGTYPSVSRGSTDRAARRRDSSCGPRVLRVSRQASRRREDRPGAFTPHLRGTRRAWRTGSRSGRGDAQTARVLLRRGAARGAQDLSLGDGDLSEAGIGGLGWHGRRAPI
jgi:hypothetical protein